MLPRLALSALIGATVSLAARISVAVQENQLVHPSSLPSSTHAVLLGPPGVRYDALLRRDNSFVFPDVNDASYLLTIHSRDFIFPPLRIDVGKTEGEATQQTITAWQTFRGNEWSNKGPQYGSAQGSLNIEIRPTAQKDFYIQRGGFNIISFLKSPMILMSLVSVVMIFGLPKMMENMDPEMKAEMEQMQSKGSITGAEGAASQIQNFDFAGWMAGKTAPASGSGGSNKKR